MPDFDSLPSAPIVVAPVPPGLQGRAPSAPAGQGGLNQSFAPFRWDSADEMQDGADAEHAEEAESLAFDAYPPGLAAIVFDDSDGDESPYLGEHDHGWHVPIPAGVLNPFEAQPLVYAMESPFLP